MAEGVESEDSAVQLRVLRKVNGVEFAVYVGSESWLLGVDALVIPWGPSGEGNFGRAIQHALGITLPDTSDVGFVKSSEPRVVSLAGLPPSALSPDESRSAAAPYALETLILATAHFGDPPGPVASIDAAAEASAASLSAAAANGVRRMGLPLLGTGVLRLDVSTIAAAVIRAIWRDFALAPRGQLEQVVFLALEDETADAIVEAWTKAEETWGPAVAASVELLSDAPISEERHDLLGHADLAAALAVLIDHRSTGTPLTIAINAPWGAGKTSLTYFIESELKDLRIRDALPIICRFNAWYHDDAPNIATALAAAVARSVSHERATWRRFFDPLPSRLLTAKERRRRHFWVTSVGIALALIVYFTSKLFTNATSRGITFAVIVGLLPALGQQLVSLSGTADQVADLVRTPDAAFATGSVKDISDDLRELIHQATRRGRRKKHPPPTRRLVVFIDDLERCQPAKSIAVCETVTQLLAHEDVVVVLVGDIQALANAAEIKYKDLVPRYATPSTGGNGDHPRPSSFGHIYLDKIIQFRFDLPTHDREVLKRVARELLNVGEGPRDASTADESPSGEATSAADRPGTASATAEHTVSASPHEGDGDSQKRTDTLQILEELDNGRYVDKGYLAIAEYVPPFPRDVKRVLNRIRFMLYLSMRRRLLEPAGPLTSECIAKWALVTEKWPEFAAKVSGKPTLWSWIESSAKQDDVFRSRMVRVVPGYVESADLQDVLCAEPALGPYATVLSRLRADPVQPVPSR
jgi:hypothetical protein